jgi:xanthine dehydrogenase accessory factor
VQGLRAALALSARRVFFVASARKAQVLKASLIDAGSDAAAVQAIVAPAGTPIGAQTPEEIALSVLGAVVAARREGAASVARPEAADVAASPVATPAPVHANKPLPASLFEPVVAGSCCGGPS